MKINLREIVLLPLFGVMMFISKLFTDPLPNIHLIAMFIVVFTVVFRIKALVSIYIFVFLLGLYSGFSVWWMLHLYIWLPLWAVIMLLPRNMSKNKALVVYIICTSLHGFLYGILCTPLQALAFGLDFNGIIIWIIKGLPFDLMHGIGNIFTSFLILPLIDVLKKALKVNNI